MDPCLPIRSQSEVLSTGYPPELQRSKTDGGPDVSRPADRHNFRAQFVKVKFDNLLARPEPLKPVLWKKDHLDITCAAPALMTHAVTYLLPRAKASFRHGLLPACNSSGWQSLSDINCVIEDAATSANKTLSHLLEELDEIRYSCDIPAETLRERLAKVQLGLADVKISAQRSSHLYEQVSSQLTELLKHIGIVADESSGDHSMADPIEKAQKVVALSREQAEAVTCPRSIFLQGRSGTGKTLVLVRRIVRACRAQATSQLYVTKSSLLQEDVSKQLSHLECNSASPNTWPPAGVLCVTWQQLRALLGYQSTAKISYEWFLKEYWPHLSYSARNLPPLLVWTEFNTRLRPFETRARALTLPEYISKKTSAVGIHLDETDLRGIHSMFARYTSLKQKKGESDDVDMAMRIRSQLPRAKVDCVSIDEAQDFSPSELMLLMELCRNIDGVTVAGDTCQTINPGSAFSFRAIAESFYAMWVHHGILEPQKAAELVDISQLTLCCNYRSTSGVTSLACSVMQLLQRFPHCIDAIEEESSFWEASELPVFINRPGQVPGHHITGKGTSCISVADASRVVIVVPTDSVRRILRQEAVTGIIILTVAEAKGLEFDIVVVCGFFTSLSDATVASLADANSEETRIAELTTGLKGILYREGAGARLSPEAHERLCRVAMAIPELKKLYVAITRARQGCVFLECGRNVHNWERILRMWHNHGLVELRGEQLQEEPETEIKKKKNNKKNDVLDLTTEKGLRRWIESELAARRAQNHEFNQERNYLKWGLKCLQNGSLTVDFYAKFNDMVRKRQGSSHSCGADLTNNQPIENKADEPSVATAEVESFVPEIVRRFCSNIPQEDATEMYESLRKRALQLYAHGMDNPRERWALFEEARLGLIQARRVVESAFEINLLRRGHHLEMVPHTMAIILQDICGIPSWRGGTSKLRLLRSVYLWRHIWTFLVEPEIDTSNAVCIALEEARTHAQLSAELTKEIVLAKAWHLSYKMHFDAQLLSESAKLNDDVLQAFEVQGPSSWKKGSSIKKAVESLWKNYQIRANVCAEAGRAFSAVGQLRHAAVAFTEASDVVASFMQTPHCWQNMELLRGRSSCQLTEDVFQRWHTFTLIRAEIYSARVDLKLHGLRAARSWLLIACASGFGNGWASGESTMEAMGKSLIRSGLVPSAIRCAARARNIEIAALLLVSAMFSTHF